jgi:hypothetical protein
MNVPLCVSTGLALTALAVEKRGGLFEFQSIKEIRALCLGVEVISCDEDAQKSRWSGLGSG